MERLDAEASSIPGEDEIAKLRGEKADAEAQLARFDRGTEVMLAESDGALSRAKAELQEHAAKLDRLRDQSNAYWRSYFETDRGGPGPEAIDLQVLPEGGDGFPTGATPADLFAESVDSLPPWWEPVVR